MIFIATSLTRTATSLQQCYARPQHLWTENSATCAIPHIGFLFRWLQQQHIDRHIFLFIDELNLAGELIDGRFRRLRMHLRRRLRELRGIAVAGADILQELATVFLVVGEPIDAVFREDRCQFQGVFLVLANKP